MIGRAALVLVVGGGMPPSPFRLTARGGWVRLGADAAGLSAVCQAAGLAGAQWLALAMGELPPGALAWVELAGWTAPPD